MTDNNVVPFRTGKSPTSRQIVEQERIAQDHRDREERLSRLREALAKNPKMGGEDQLVIAHALHDLLDRIERQHLISKANILREAGSGAPRDSTTHLSQYAIPRDLPAEEIRRRSARLRKGTRPYEKIARAAARLAGLAEDDLLFEVFGQANFWRSNVREAAPEFVELARRLRLVAE